MKLKLLQQDLLPKLQAVSRSTGVRTSLPVLANILLQTDGNKLCLSATNLEIGVIKKISADVSEPGEVTIPSKTLVEVISSLTNAEIELESNGEQLKIVTKNFEATLNGIPASEFPAIPLASENNILMDGKVLKEAVPEIAFAAAVDEGRPVLTGILTEIKSGSFELVATDGFRLAHKTTKIDTQTTSAFKSLIPRKTFEEVVRLLGEELTEDNQQIEISTSESQNQMVFKVGDTQLSSRLIEGQFPSWEKIVPTSKVATVTLDRAVFLKAVKLASVFAKDAANVIKIEVVENKIKITSEAKELGGQEMVMDAITEGETLSIAFNSRFLTDALSACNSEQVALELSGSISPALINPVGVEGLEYVIMPIRLS